MRTKGPKLSSQIKHAVLAEEVEKHDYDGNTEVMISTGCTLLDLAISGGRKRGGGIPGGVLVEIFGPPSCGKTVLLCEIAGNIQRKGGEVMFYDPEARLNKQFAKLFGLDIETLTYSMPSTVPEVFAPIRKKEFVSTEKINGVIADSLAALSTELEMEDTDKMGMRRAKEFSEELRKTCRVLVKKNLLMVCSNQVRENVNAGMYEQKYRTPGGLSIGFYASLRLRCSNPQKIKREKTVGKGKPVTRVVGVDTQIEVYKSSVWKPYHTVVVPIMFDYGIDDIQANLQFIKDFHKRSSYTVGEISLGNSLDLACKNVETDNLQRKLRKEVLDLWEEIETHFVQSRQPKH